MSITPLKIDNMANKHAEKCPSLSNDELCKCDGYHTFDELYEHRATLYIMLCKVLKNNARWGSGHLVWRSKLHADGSMYDNMFILGISTKKGEQISYHLEMDKWHDCCFARELDKAPGFDGHTSDDVLERLKKL